MTFGVSVVGILFLSTSSWEKAAINTNIQYSTDHKIKLPNTLLYLWYKPRSGGNLIDDVGCYIGCPVSSKFILTISGHTLNTAQHSFPQQSFKESVDKEQKLFCCNLFCLIELENSMQETNIQFLQFCHWYCEEYTNKTICNTTWAIQWPKGRLKWIKGPEIWNNSST